MSKEQVGASAMALVSEHPEFRGKYYAVAKSIADAIAAELGGRISRLKIQ